MPELAISEEQRTLIIMRANLMPVRWRERFINNAARDAWRIESTSFFLISWRQPPHRPSEHGQKKRRRWMMRLSQSPLHARQPAPPAGQGVYS
jgi:hypothetical protein